MTHSPCSRDSVPPPRQEVLDVIIAHTCDTTELGEQLAREALAREAVLTSRG